MAIARRQLIDVDTTPYYHIICRCVRRAFLCGKDKFTGRDFSHRQQWIEDKLASLSQIFTIDIAAYAIMNNHYHLVLRIDKETTFKWTTPQVFEQYQKLHITGPIVQQYLDGATLSHAQLLMIEELAITYRERLMSISWFMKLLNQSIANRANKEDKCSGKFFESRFKSQALLDETAVLTCMTYVDLNPIRAGLTTTPETSDFTSIQTRLNRKPKKSLIMSKSLLPFAKDNMKGNDVCIPITKAAYFELVDWTGRCIRNDKRGAIPHNVAPLLDRININEHEWLRQTRYFEARFKRVAGNWESIKRAAKRLGKHWFQGKPPKPKPLPTE